MRNPDEFWMRYKTGAFRTVRERLPFSMNRNPLRHCFAMTERVLSFLPVRDAAAAVVFFLVVVHAALGLLDEGFELDAAGAAGSAAHGD